MFSNAILLLALSFVGAVCAQSSAASTAAAAAPTSTSGISPCILNCTTTAAADSGCKSITNTTCVCTSQKFQAAALTCLKASCTAAEQQAATALQAATCANVAGNGTSPSKSANGTASGAASTPTAPGGSSGNSTASGGNSTASAAPKSGAAMALRPAGLGITHAVGAVSVVLAMVSGVVALL